MFWMQSVSMVLCNFMQVWKHQAPSIHQESDLVQNLVGDNVTNIFVFWIGYYWFRCEYFWQVLSLKIDDQYFMSFVLCL